MYKWLFDGVRRRVIPKYVYIISFSQQYLTFEMKPIEGSSVLLKMNRLRSYGIEFGRSVFFNFQKKIHHQTIGMVNKVVFAISFAKIIAKYFTFWRFHLLAFSINSLYLLTAAQLLFSVSFESDRHICARARVLFAKRHTARPTNRWPFFGVTMSVNNL